MTYLQSGRVRHPSDVTPMSLIHEHNKWCLPLGWAGYERVTRPWNVVIKARQETWFDPAVIDDIERD